MSGKWVNLTAKKHYCTKVPACKTHRNPDHSCQPELTKSYKKCNLLTPLLRSNQTGQLNCVLGIILYIVECIKRGSQRPLAALPPQMKLTLWKPNMSGRHKLTVILFLKFSPLHS